MPVIGRCDHRIGASERRWPAATGAARVRWSLSPLALNTRLNSPLCGVTTQRPQWPIKRLGIVLKGCDGISVD